MPNPWATPSDGGNNQRSAGGAPAGVLNTPAMQSLMQQMGDNPAMMQNLINAPYTRTMMESMAADPAMATNVNNTKYIIDCDKCFFF